MDKKSIAKGIGMGIIAGILVIGILVVVALYLNLIDKSQILGKERAEPTVYADSRSRDIIVNALNRISEQEQMNVSDYITDIHVVDDINNTPCTNLKPPGYEVFGCEIPHTNIFGLINTSIYILRENSGKYSDACLTFIYVTYHEIGHTLYQMRYGIPSKEDDIYRKSLETYADGIADKYVRFDKTKKEGCKEYYLAQEVEKANQTLNIAREKLESAREKLESAKEYLDSTEIDIQNAKTIVESDNSNVVQTGNELTTWKNRVSQCGFWCKLLDNSEYKQALSELDSARNKYNSAIDKYNTDVDIYNNAVNTYKNAVNTYNGAVDRYNIAKKEFDSAVDNYNSKLRMELISISDQ